MTISLNKFDDSMLFLIIMRTGCFAKCKVLYLNAYSMQQKINKYRFPQLASAVFMILALLWLTVSAPIVYASQQKLAKQEKIINTNTPADSNEEETANPFGSNTEEKAPSSSSFSEEYLHDHHTTDHFFSIVQQYHKCENAGTYVAFHGELLVPPPNVA
jgi:hypothetical protein